MGTSIAEFKARLHGLVVEHLKSTTGSDACAGRAPANITKLESIAFLIIGLGILSLSVTVWYWLVTLA